MFELKAFPPPLPSQSVGCMVGCMNSCLSPPPFACAEGPQSHAIGSWEDSTAPLIGRRSDPIGSTSSSSRRSRRSSAAATDYYERAHTMPRRATAGSVVTSLVADEPEPHIPIVPALPGPGGTGSTGGTAPAIHHHSSPFADRDAQGDVAEDLLLPPLPLPQPVAAIPGGHEAEADGTCLAHAHVELEEASMNYTEETLATVAKIWPVLIAFMMSVTVLYTVCGGEGRGGLEIWPVLIAFMMSVTVLYTVWGRGGKRATSRDTYDPSSFQPLQCSD